MIKFLIPTIIIFLIVLFWERINKFIHERFKIKTNFIVLILLFIIIGIVLTLLYF